MEIPREFYEKKPKRNKEIYEKWKAGVSHKELIKEYNLSQSRVYQIIKREQKKA